MENAEREKFKTKLLELRSRLTVEINRMTEAVLSDVRAPGEHEQAASEAVDKEIILENTEEEIRRAVNDALQRIEEETFGSCEDCGGHIAKARLQAVPYTAYCISCERKREAS